MLNKLYFIVKSGWSLLNKRSLENNWKTCQSKGDIIRRLTHKDFNDNKVNKIFLKGLVYRVFFNQGETERGKKL